MSIYNSTFRGTSFEQKEMEFRKMAEDDFKEMFRLLDTRKTGKVPINDLKTVMESIGNTGRNSMVYHLLIYHQNQGKKDIDFNDFMEILSQRLDMVHSEEDHEKLFSRFDPKLEYIDFETLKQVSIELNEHLDNYDLKQMIDACEPKTEGKVTFDEFYRMMTTLPNKKTREELKRGTNLSTIQLSETKKK